MDVVDGCGTPNPGVRFHLWIYRERPAFNAIVHTHPPHASALGLVGEPLVAAHMDTMMFYNNCAFLPDWPGAPLFNEEGRIISQALGDNRAILLAHHGLLTTGGDLDEALYLAVSLERACRMQLAARSVGEIRPVDPGLAERAKAFMVSPELMTATVDYWLRGIASAPRQG
jgi:L-fuculose-phosphate aldolase